MSNNKNGYLRSVVGAYLGPRASFPCDLSRTGWHVGAEVLLSRSIADGTISIVKGHLLVVTQGTDANHRTPTNTLVAARQ